MPAPVCTASCPIAWGDEAGYFLLTYTPGASWNHAISYEEQPGLKKHHEYLKDLHLNDILVMGGNVDGDDALGVMLILNATGVVDEDSEGITVRGAKMLGTGSIMANEVLFGALASGGRVRVYVKEDDLAFQFGEQLIAQCLAGLAGVFGVASSDCVNDFRGGGQPEVGSQQCLLEVRPELVVHARPAQHATQALSHRVPALRQTIAQARSDGRRLHLRSNCGGKGGLSSFAEHQRRSAAVANGVIVN